MHETRDCSELPCTTQLSRNRRKFRRSTGKLLDAVGKVSERLVHVFQHLGSAPCARSELLKSSKSDSHSRCSCPSSLRWG